MHYNFYTGVDGIRLSNHVCPPVLGLIIPTFRRINHSITLTYTCIWHCPRRSVCDVIPITIHVHTGGGSQTCLNEKRLLLHWCSFFIYTLIPGFD